MLCLCCVKALYRRGVYPIMSYDTATHDKQMCAFIRATYTRAFRRVLLYIWIGLVLCACACIEPRRVYTCPESGRCTLHEAIHHRAGYLPLYRMRPFVLCQGESGRCNAWPTIPHTCNRGPMPAVYSTVTDSRCEGVNARCGVVAASRDVNDAYATATSVTSRTRHHQGVVIFGCHKLLINKEN